MIVTAQSSFFLMLLLLGVGGIGSLAFDKDKMANIWGNGLAIIASVFGLISSSLVLVLGAGFSFRAGSSLPLLSLSFNVDQLAAFFIFVISLISLLSSIYALGYV